MSISIVFQMAASTAQLILREKQNAKGKEIGRNIPNALLVCLVHLLSGKENIAGLFPVPFLVPTVFQLMVPRLLRRGPNLQVSSSAVTKTLLDGGFKYFSCSPLFGEDSHFD